MIGVLLFGSGACVGWVWRHQRARFYQAKYEAEEARTKLSAIIESSEDAIISKSLDGIITSWNAGAEHIYGYSAAKVIGRPIAILIPPEHPNEFPQLTEKIKRGEAIKHYETDRIRKNGERIQMSLTLSPIKDASGAIAGISVIGRNITERKQAENDLRRSETKFRTLYDSTRNAVMLLDTKGFFDCNQATLTMFGCATREEFYTKHPADLSPLVQPDGTDSLTLANQRIATAMEKGSNHFEWMHKRADTSKIFPADVLLSAMELDGRQVLQAVVRDITERKQAEEKLSQLSRAVEQSPASIVITNPAGDIEYVNPKFVDLTGYTLAEALGKNPRILKSDEKGPEAYRELWETITAGKEWRGEFHNKKKNGELYWESASISPIRDPAGRITHFLAVKEDITARKQTEAERDKLIQDLQDALANVKSLSGLLPICASCKKIRDDKGYWDQVESYIQKHSEAKFSHGMCPDCIKKWYPDLKEGVPGDSTMKAP
jgi:PAS domain S-box-containing protein